MYSAADAAAIDAAQSLHDSPEGGVTLVTSPGSRFWNAAPEILSVLTPEGIIKDANPAWERILHRAPDMVRGTSVFGLVHPDDEKTLRAAFVQAAFPSASSATLEGGDAQYAATEPDESAADVVVRMRDTDATENGDGALRWMQWSLIPEVCDASGGTPCTLLGTARDVTETRKAASALQWMAHHDALTELPNRALLEDRLNHALAGAQRRRHCLAVLFFDVDQLKPVNDTWGHAAGDHILREVARRLTVHLRDEDTVARLGGDEFVVVLPVVHGVDDAERVGRKLMDAVGTPLLVPPDILSHSSQSVSVTVTASMGIAVFPRDGQTAADLLKHADAAMYHHKSRRPNRSARANNGVGFAAAFSATTDTATVPESIVPKNAPFPAPAYSSKWSSEWGQEPIQKSGQTLLQMSLSRAVDRHEMHLYYQPQVCLSTGQTTGVEALLRWQNAQWGSVPPNTFIPLAEASGLMKPLGAWALHEACRQGADWRRGGHAVTVAVNVSAQQLGDSRLPDNLLRWLDRLDLPPQAVDLELSEAALQNSDAHSLNALRLLKKRGVRLSVDDLGTGSVAFAPAILQKLPLDTVKIDRSFIRRIDTDDSYQEVVRAITDLSHALGMRVVAEGVETTSQRDALADLGCDAMQGYLISAAVPPGDVRAFFGR